MPDSYVDEQTLVECAKAGDAEAFGELYQHYLDAIYRYIYFRVEIVQDAEDLTEQVFLRAWEALPDYKQCGYPFSSWLYRIAHNITVDYHRRKRQSVPIPTIEQEQEKLHSAVSSSLQQVIQAEEAQMLAGAIAQLPEAQQQVIILRFVEGLNHDVIANILDKSNGACRTLQYRALTTLSQLLTEEREVA